jgi:hypothetical protein
MVKLGQALAVSVASPVSLPRLSSPVFSRPKKTLE